jgi:hypothetical protein
MVRESKFSWLVIILVQEAILIVIPMGGHLDCYPYGSQIFILQEVIIPKYG